MRYYVVITSSTAREKTVKLVTETEKTEYKQEEGLRIFPYLSRLDRVENLATKEVAFVKNVDYTREEVVVFYALEREEAVMEAMGLLCERNPERRWKLNGVESYL